MSYRIHIVDPSGAEAVYRWHARSATQESYIAPLVWQDFKKIILSSSAIIATEATAGIVSLAYFARQRPKLQADNSESRWIVGGLVTASGHRKNGLSQTVACVTLAHVLFQEDPLSRNEPIIAHVSVSNGAPRNLLERLGFSRSRQITSANGVYDEFVFDAPKALLLLADWCRDWAGRLPSGDTVKIVFPKGVDTKLWRSAFLDMAGV